MAKGGLDKIRVLFRLMWVCVDLSCHLIGIHYFENVRNSLFNRNSLLNSDKQFTKKKSQRRRRKKANRRQSENADANVSFACTLSFNWIYGHDSECHLIPFCLYHLTYNEALFFLVTYHLQLPFQTRSLVRSLRL